jgi:hypothetical protein
VVDCVICRYWSERLEEARLHAHGTNASKEEKRLSAAFRSHQFGACACKFPDLLRDLVKPEPATTEFCDPLRVRILAGNLEDEFAAVATLGLQ